MDYNERENQIVEYIKESFNNFTEKSIDHYINEYLDFDAYTFNNSVFFQFDGYEYQQLTNESKLETLNMTIYIVVRNNTEKKLHESLRDFTSAFYNMFEASGYNFKGIVDQGMISSINFYDAVEANKCIKLCKIDLVLYKETI
jgi:hypothetical protein